MLTNLRSDMRGAVVHWIRSCGADGVAIRRKGETILRDLDQIAGRSETLAALTANELLDVRPAYRDRRGDLREAPDCAEFGHDERAGESWIRLGGAVIHRNFTGRWTVWRGGMGGRSFGTAPEAWDSLT